MRVRWRGFSPVWNQLQQLQGEMNQLFDRWNGSEGATAEGIFPALNVWEEGDQVAVEAELPGLDLKDLEIYVLGGNQLSIKGERKPNVPDKGTWHRRERAYGTFSRTLTLPFPVDPDKVDARLEQGVLRLTLSKHESARARKIPVRGE